MTQTVANFQIFCLSEVGVARLLHFLHDVQDREVVVFVIRSAIDRQQRSLGLVPALVYGWAEAVSVLRARHAGQALLGLPADGRVAVRER